MAVVLLSEGYWRMLKHAPQPVRAAVAQFLQRLEALEDGVAFPGDPARLVPPAAQWMCHAIPGSTWVVYYTVAPDRIVVRTVTTG